MSRNSSGFDINVVTPNLEKELDMMEMISAIKTDKSREAGYDFEATLQKDKKADEKVQS